MSHVIRIANPLRPFGHQPFDTIRTMSAPGPPQGRKRQANLLTIFIDFSLLQSTALLASSFGVPADRRSSHGQYNKYTTTNKHSRLHNQNLHSSLDSTAPPPLPCHPLHYTTLHFTPHHHWQSKRPVLRFPTAAPVDNERLCFLPFSALSLRHPIFRTAVSSVPFRIVTGASALHSPPCYSFGPASRGNLAGRRAGIGVTCFFFLCSFLVGLSVADLVGMAGLGGMVRNGRMDGLGHMDGMDWRRRDRTGPPFMMMFMT